MPLGQLKPKVSASRIGVRENVQHINSMPYNYLMVLYPIVIVSKNDTELSSGPPAGGKGKLPPNLKNFVAKWCYFPVMYKMTKVLKDGIENR